MNLLDKAISDVKQRKSKKTQDRTTPTLEGTSLANVGSTLYRDAQYISDYSLCKHNILCFCFGIS